MPDNMATPRGRVDCSRNRANVPANPTNRIERGKEMSDTGLSKIMFLILSSILPGATALAQSSAAQEGYGMILAIDSKKVFLLRGNDKKPAEELDPIKPGDKLVFEASAI